MSWREADQADDGPSWKISEQLPERGDHLGLQAFTGEDPTESLPACDIDVLYIDRECDVWVCRDRLTREVRFYRFAPNGSWWILDADVERDHA